MHYNIKYIILLLATEYHLGLLKAKLARYRAQLIEPTSKSGPKVSIVLLIAYDGISHVLPPCYPLCKIVQFHSDVALTREDV